MAKKKIRVWSEAELIDAFTLTKLLPHQHHLLNDWLAVPSLALSPFEQTVFNQILRRAELNIGSWNEEDLKMNFIAFVLDLAQLTSNDKFRTYFEKTVEATVEGHYLKIKSDFMVAKGILDLVKTPYFHFQEYKQEKDPYGDPLAQLLEAFLVAQENNKNGNPLYGCFVRGRIWHFVTMEAKTYCVSKAYDCTEEPQLLAIIAILRRFREILETRLLD
jgi:hypothetical protein